MKNSLFTIFLLFLNLSFGQSSIVTAKSPEDLTAANEVSEKSNKLEYSKISGDDVLWSKVVYEHIDLNEKLNFPLLFPLNDKLYKDGRKSLWKIIKEGVENGDIKRVFASRNDNFKLEDAITGKDSIQNSYGSKYVKGEDDIPQSFAESKDIQGYNIKGVWYFDKKHSELKYKLIGLQPLGKDLQNEDTKEPTPYFWIWYDSIRELLSQNLVFNDRNNNSSISFDDLLVNRRFNSYIYKYDNVYGDRKIEEYIVQRDGESDESYRIRFILESERIKKEILDFENDMWGY